LVSVSPPIRFLDFLISDYFHFTWFTCTYFFLFVPLPPCFSRVQIYKATYELGRCVISFSISSLEKKIHPGQITIKNFHILNPYCSYSRKPWKNSNNFMNPKKNLKSVEPQNPDP
jgi:hypothetical protein